MSKKSLLSITLLGMTALALALAASSLQADPTAPKATTSVFDIEGMTCGGCETGVKLAVKKLDGVSGVEASYKDGRAEVSYDATKVTPEQIVAAIEKLGYTAELRTESAKKG